MTDREASEFLATVLDQMDADTPPSPRQKLCAALTSLARSIEASDLIGVVFATPDDDIEGLTNLAESMGTMVRSLDEVGKAQVLLLKASRRPA